MTREVDMDEQNKTNEFYVNGHYAPNEGWQRNGSLAPVFPALLTGSAKEESYVARMIHRDRELNWG